MLNFENITEDILRLKVPFENIYTAVFLVKTADGAFLVDSATTEYDAKEVILPALRRCIELDKIKYIVCTHLHGDHGGGVRYLLPALKNAKVAAASARAAELYGEENVVTVHDGDTVCGVKLHSFKGHSLDCIGLYDERSGTLILGDSVQLYGITKYGCGVGFPKEYRETLARIRTIGAKMLVASHEYYPLGSIAKGDGVNAYLDMAQKAFSRVEAFVRANKEIGDAAKIAAAFTAEARISEPDMPILQAGTVKALLKEIY